MPRKSAPVKQFKTDNKSREENKVDAEDQVIGGGFESVEDIQDALPEFLKPENIADKNGKAPTIPSTIIPLCTSRRMHGRISRRP